MPYGAICHIEKLNNNAKQDSLIFVGSNANNALLEDLQINVPDMFRSDCPVFMPRGYLNMVKQRLDNNVIFYENFNETYNLTDIFAVNGGPTISLPLASWDHRNHFQLQMGLNRWDRRTDLRGAKFVNTLWFNGRLAYFICDIDGKIKIQDDDDCFNGTIIGSSGYMQEKLFYMTERLNLAIETKNRIKSVEGRPTEIPCERLLNKKMTDICSGGKSLTQGSTRITIITERPYIYTLFAGVPKDNVLDVWAYTNVFGMSQWLLYFSLLIIISLFMLMAKMLLDGIYQRNPVNESFANTYLFLLQQGSHPDTRHYTTKILSLTLSLVTLLLYIYYANDITAKMTAGSPGHPVRNFEDVIDNGYKVIVVGWESNALYKLKDSKSGSAKHNVYKLYLEDGYEKSAAWENATRNGNVKEASGIKKPSWYDWTLENVLEAAKQIIRDKKTLWYTTRSGVPESVKDDGRGGGDEGRVIELKMDDASRNYRGVMLRQDSEYLPMFRHYALKGFESGIFQRIDLRLSDHCLALRNVVCWPYSRPAIQIGMTEPGSLGMGNVIFPFSFLGACLVIAVGIGVLENVVNKLSYSKNKVGLLLEKQIFLWNLKNVSYNMLMVCKLFRIFNIHKSLCKGRVDRLRLGRGLRWGGK